MPLVRGAVHGDHVAVDRRRVGIVGSAASCSASFTADSVSRPGTGTGSSTSQRWMKPRASTGCVAPLGR